MQGDARAKAKAEAEKQEAAKKEIAELMAKAKADMDKEDKDKAQDAQADADDLKKEVYLLPCKDGCPTVETHVCRLVVLLLPSPTAVPYSFSSVLKACKMHYNVSNDTAGSMWLLQHLCCLSCCCKFCCCSSRHGNNVGSKNLLLQLKSQIDSYPSIAVCRSRSPH